MPRSTAATAVSAATLAARRRTDDISRASTSPHPRRALTIRARSPRRRRVRTCRFRSTRSCPSCRSMSSSRRSCPTSFPREELHTTPCVTAARARRTPPPRSRRSDSRSRLRLRRRALPSRRLRRPPCVTHSPRRRESATFSATFVTSADSSRSRCRRRSTWFPTRVPRGPPRHPAWVWIPSPPPSPQRHPHGSVARSRSTRRCSCGMHLVQRRHSHPQSPRRSPRFRSVHDRLPLPPPELPRPRLLPAPLPRVALPPARPRPPVAARLPDCFDGLSGLAFPPVPASASRWRSTA